MKILGTTHLESRNASAAPRRSVVTRCLFLLIPMMAISVLGVSQATAQPSGLDPTKAPIINPLEVLQEGSQVMPGFEDGLSAPLNFLILLTVLTIAPSILVMCTCFTRFIVVLALARQAMGTAQLPPAQVLTGLALLLTFVVMAPTIERIHEEAIVPYQQGDPAVSSQLDVWNRAKEPLRDFMFNQIERAENWDGLYMLLEYRGYDTENPEGLTYDDVDMLTLIPAFIMSELKVAFLIGIRVYLPFLVIDMVIASLLISMGMLMLPPVLISLPFKLLLFVLVDGWQLIIGNLLLSVEQGLPEAGVSSSALQTATDLSFNLTMLSSASGFG